MVRKWKVAIRKSGSMLVNNVARIFLTVLASGSFYAHALPVSPSRDSSHVTNSTLHHPSYYSFFFTPDDFFCILDDTSNIPKTMFWPNAMHDRMACSPGFVAIFPVSSGYVKADIDILETENDSISLAMFDHVVQGNIRITIGNLELFDCASSTIVSEIPLAPGNYGVRVYFQNLVERNVNEKNYRYRIEIWPSANVEQKVLKQLKR